MNEEQTARTEAKFAEFTALLKACDADHPSKEQVTALRKQLHETPQMWTLAGNLTKRAADAVLADTRMSPAIRLSVDTGREMLRKELGYYKAPLMEQQLIEHVVLCWVRLQTVEMRYIEAYRQEMTLQQGAFWEKRLSAVQKRYLRAVESLARVRRLAVPAVQVNIAEQQINVAGG